MQPGVLGFAPLPAPTDDAVQKLLLRVGRRIEQAVALCEHDEVDAALDDEQRAMQHSLVEAATPPAEQRLQAGLYLPPPDKPRCAHIDGYSLHANVA